MNISARDSIKGFFVKLPVALGYSTEKSYSMSKQDTSSSNDNTTTHEILSLRDVQHRIGQESIEVEWTGEKFVPKSFGVYRLIDLTDKLQVN